MRPGPEGTTYAQYAKQAREAATEIRDWWKSQPKTRRRGMLVGAAAGLIAAGLVAREVNRRNPEIAQGLKTKGRAMVTEVKGKVAPVVSEVRATLDPHITSGLETAQQRVRSFVDKQLGRLQRRQPAQSGEPAEPARVAEPVRQAEPAAV